MLLDEAPSTLIHECIGNFNIDPDRGVLSRISSNRSTLSSHRSLQLSTVKSSLKRTTRQLHTLEQRHNITLSAHDPVNHAEILAKYDDERFQLAKEANALESEGSRLEGELGGLKRQLEDVERKGENDWEGRGGELQDVLRLKLYRSLGIDAEADKHGNITRALVRNGQRPEVAVIEMDPKVPQANYVDRIWESV